MGGLPIPGAARESALPSDTGVRSARLGAEVPQERVACLRELDCSID